MDFLTRKVYLPTPVYRALPALYLIAAVALWIFVDHTAGVLGGAALAILAVTILFKRSTG